MRIALASFLLTLACGPSAPNPPTVAPATAEPPAEPPPGATAEPAPVAADPHPADPTALPAASDETRSALSALLGDAPAPITLAHARALARSGAWLASAAVYDALLAEEPNDAHLLSGRGYALLRSGDARALPLSRLDLDRALSLARTDRARAMVHFNIGVWEEASGNPPAALASYLEAHRLNGGVRASAEAITRLGGTPPPHHERARGELSEVQRASEVRTLVEVAAVVIASFEADYLADDFAPPATEEAAATFLGEDFDAHGPSLSSWVPHEGLDEVHLIVPSGSGFWVLPRVAGAPSGPTSRCPDSVSLDLDPITSGGRRFVVLRSTMLENYFDECDYAADDDDCLEGCYWTGVHDAAVVLDIGSGRYVRGSLDRDVAPSGNDPPSSWRGDPVALSDTTLSIRDCGEVALTDLE